MAIEVYCEDQDMQEIRPNILDLGVSSWLNQRKEAFENINRVIANRWYRKVAIQKSVDAFTEEFDPDKVKEDSLKRLACFKALELAYMFLMKDSSEPDGFERNMKTFRNRYNEELELVLAFGVEYDWDGDGTITPDEKNIRTVRRLVRG
jgi:hypothetical protein